MENYLLRFIDFLGSKYEVYVICKNGRRGDLAGKFEDLGCKIVILKTGPFNINSWARLYTFFSKQKLDVVCDLGGNFSGIYMFLAYLAGIKRRSAYYGQNQNHFSKSFLKEIYSCIVSIFVKVFATKIVSNSSHSFDFFFGKNWLLNPKFQVIENGVNSDIFSLQKDFSIRTSLGIPDNAFVIGHTGRLDIKKNHKAILNIANLLNREYQDIYFLLVGKNTEYLLREIEDKGLQNKVFAIGFRADSPLVYKNFDCFLFPSYTEGLSNSLIEALLSGLPVIASNIIENRDALPSELHPFLFAPDDILTAKNLILKVYNNRRIVNSDFLRSYAEKRYNSNERFAEFLRSLN